MLAHSESPIFWAGQGLQPQIALYRAFCICLLLQVCKLSPALPRDPYEQSLEQRNVPVSPRMHALKACQFHFQHAVLITCHYHEQVRRVQKDPVLESQDDSDNS